MATLPDWSTSQTSLDPIVQDAANTLRGAYQAWRTANMNNPEAQYTTAEQKKYLPKGWKAPKQPRQTEAWQAGQMDWFDQYGNVIPASAIVGQGEDPRKMLGDYFAAGGTGATGTYRSSAFSGPVSGLTGLPIPQELQSPVNTNLRMPGTAVSSMPSPTTSTSGGIPEPAPRWSGLKSFYGAGTKFYRKPKQQV